MLLYNLMLFHCYYLKYVDMMDEPPPDEMPPDEDEFVEDQEDEFVEDQEGGQEEVPPDEVESQMNEEDEEVSQPFPHTISLCYALLYMYPCIC